jgi:hypothetical protein
MPVTKIPNILKQHSVLEFVFNKIQTLFGSIKNVMQLKKRLISYSTNAINCT